MFASSFAPLFYRRLSLPSAVVWRLGTPWFCLLRLHRNSIPGRIKAMMYLESLSCLFFGFARVPRPPWPSILCAVLTPDVVGSLRRRPSTATALTGLPGASALLILPYSRRSSFRPICASPSSFGSVGVTRLMEACQRPLSVLRKVPDSNRRGPLPAGLSVSPRGLGPACYRLQGAFIQDGTRPTLSANLPLGTVAPVPVGVYCSSASMELCRYA